MTALLRDYTHHRADGERLLIEYRAGRDIEIVRVIDGAGDDFVLPEQEMQDISLDIECELDLRRVA